MELDTRVSRLADQVAAMQQQVNSLYVSPGATAAEIERIKALEDVVRAKDVELATLKLSIADLSKRLAALPTRSEMRDHIDRRTTRAAELTGEALGTFQGDARAYAEEVVQDASLVFRRETEKARNAAEANTAAAVSFVRRSLHRWCA